MKRFDEMSFPSDFAAVPWDSAFVFNKVDDVWAHWSCLYKQVLDKYAPITKKIIRGNQLPWITPVIKRDISQRNRLSKTFRRFPTVLSWEKYREQRNKTTALKRNAIKRFCTEAASSVSHAGEFWKKMKPLLPCNKTRNDGNIQLLENGNIIKEPSTLINNDFSKPIISQAALKPAVDDFKDHPSINKIKIHAPALEFSFQPVSQRSVGVDGRV